MSSEYPLRHLSVRVPWHDAGWNGTVCNAPELNGACVKLRDIAAKKNEEEEIRIAGKEIVNLSPEKRPSCIFESAAFMAPVPMDHKKRHPLVNINPNYSHLKDTLQRHPAYSASVVPFRWMLRNEYERIGEQYELSIDASRERALGYKTNWVSEVNNQIALLDGFRAQLSRDDSLIFFYAKHVPFVEQTGRILVGVGKIKNIDRLSEYEQKTKGAQSMMWERPIQHSIRPDEKDGFLMPYQKMLKLTEDGPYVDFEHYTAFAPPDNWGEFSHRSEHVTHDGAISALLSMDVALSRMETDLGIKRTRQRQWIHDELIRLWKVRGPFPGLGAVLRAFGISRGLFVAHELQQQATKRGENTDIWKEVDAAFKDPGSLKSELRGDIEILAPVWKNLPEERRKFLRLLSRFELNFEQASSLYDERRRRTHGWPITDGKMITDGKILNNPYLLYECGRYDPRNGVSLLTIDRGVFPNDTIQISHPLEEPSRLESAVDPRRVRAFTIATLEQAASEGHTLDLGDNLVESIRNRAVSPECPVTSDIISSFVGDMAPEVVNVGKDGSLILQLGRYQKIGEVVRENVRGRVNGKRHILECDWKRLIEEKFGVAKDDDDEHHAQEEKTFALTELAESRFSVLSGPAGTGKTTVLGILCAQDEIRNGGLLLLAPTGKARVRMQELVAGDNSEPALTIAQFLIRYGRYDGATGRYQMDNERPRETNYDTVIVDEASMLTEDMLGALLDALQGVKRLILVGDPAQLPPIGAGRPFVDIINELRPTDYESQFPRVVNGYAELTIERRQAGNERPDLRLARWFSTSSPSVGDDDIFTIGDEECDELRFVEWENPADFRKQLNCVLTKELKITDFDDQSGFNKKLGGKESNGREYFNIGAAEYVENWQILSPVKGMSFGVGDINRQIHKKLRAGFTELASRWKGRPIPRPMGREQIVYGDKVINQRNHYRRDVYPQKGALGYLANGEIGIAIGQRRGGNITWAPRVLQVEFSSQKGYRYNFAGKDFNDEGEPTLELAYALTVHKAQGSQFDLVIFVLPQEHSMLSRELLYTALTRHKDRVVIMHQGPRTQLRGLSKLHRSETAQRHTNLLTDCTMLEFPQEKGSIRLQKGLVNRTRKGLAVRSNAQRIIADALDEANIRFGYEKELVIGDQTRYPSFTIEDEISGRTVYWEHLGKLIRKDDRRAWVNKLKWYRDNDIVPIEKAEESKAELIVTEGNLSLDEINELIKKIKGN